MFIRKTTWVPRSPDGFRTRLTDIPLFSTSSSTECSHRLRRGTSSLRIQPSQRDRKTVVTVSLCLPNNPMQD